MLAERTSGDCESLPLPLWNRIESAIARISFGSVSLIMQDGKIIQLEINEKIRLLNARAAATTPSVDVPDVRAEIAQAIDGLKYGQVVINIKDGTVVQIDRTEKRRFVRRNALFAR